MSIKKIINKNNGKNYTIKLLYSCIFLYLVLFICIFVYAKSASEEKVDDLQNTITEKEPTDNEEPKLKDIYEYYKSINDDYVGQIYFESGLINLPFVQGQTNDSYLRTDFETMQYSVAGTVFMDYGNDIENDQNIIIYGHNYSPSEDPSSSKMFTPLRVLKDEDNYGDNKIISLYLGNKILKYQIVSVFNVKAIEENGIQYIAEGEPIYVIRNYSKDELSEYIEKYKQREYYDTGLLIEESDKLLTLQTCVDYSTDKLIILSKLVDVIEE